MAESEPTRPEGRSSPKNLSAEAQHGPRGRLKVFLGAAPGVGKTYAMLQAAQARKREGADVVIGIAETHGRIETQTLLEGLEIIPRRRIEYRGVSLDEMDLDAVLARRPSLVLVDELAHTNAPTSRHPKRYQDVEELLAASIDVYTTLNVQHLESLNDAVAQITTVRVRETLPDRVLDDADEIQLIDLPPEDLLQRLREGKVYVPEQAQRAIENYFRPGNLNALRELALRRTADRVDDQMRDYMQTRSIPGPWPATDRIMVCVSPSPTSRRLVRSAKRRADRRNAPWMAVYVETPAHQRLSEQERDRVARTLHVAEQLGGEAVSIPGMRPADDLIRYAQSRNVTEIIIGKSQRSWWQELRYGSIVNDLIRKSGRIDVHVIRGDDSPGEAPAGPGLLPVGESGIGAYLVSAVSVVVIALAAKAVQYFTSLPNLSMLFLLGVLFVAVRWGLWPSLFACLLSALVFNFFFIEPLYTFSIAHSSELWAFIVYFIVAVIASNLTARMREQAEAARRREDRTSALFALSRALASAPDTNAVLPIVAEQVGQIVGADTVLLLNDGGTIRQAAARPAGITLSDHDLAAAQWAWQQGVASGRDTDTLPGIGWTFLPMKTARSTVGVLGVRLDGGTADISPRRRRLIEALADQAAVGIESARLRQDLEQARVYGETEKLRAALLSSVSHDLRTPLASIIGSATSLLAYGKNYDETASRDLLLTIQEEAERLNRFVGNLLDVTRLESGKLQLNQDWVEIGDLIGSTIARCRQSLASHPVTTDVEPSLPLLRMDYVLMEQVLFNLLDNAAKYSPPGTEIHVRAARQGESVRIEVTDNGRGVPPGDLERIFDKFYRVRAADRHVAGTGLGLSICRGIVEAHGGTIAATVAPAGTGLSVAVTLPIGEQPRGTIGAEEARG